MIAYAVHESRVREVIDLDVGEVEFGAFWREFLLGAQTPRLHGVRLVISDAHEGLKAAIARVLACACWPVPCRCAGPTDALCTYKFQ